MLLKTNNLRFINNLKSACVLFACLLAINVLSAQEIIEDKPKQEKNYRKKR